MHTPNERIWFSDNHTGRQNFFATQSSKFPDAGERKRLEISASKAIRLLAVVALLPLVEARRRDQATALRECLPKQRQLVNRLGPRVDVRDLWLFLHPKWN
jgi:hypothetical protein